MLKSQQADIDRLEAMDKALSNESDAAQISADTVSYTDLLKAFHQCPTCVMLINPSPSQF